MSNFIDACIQGDALLEEVDEFVEQWHESDSKRELHEFLGMTATEYSLWVVDPDILPFVVIAHRSNKGVDAVLEELEHLPLAARAESPEKAKKLLSWLKSEGLWQ